MAIRKPSETDIVRQCLDLLRLYQILAWRNNTGALRDARRRLVHFGEPGSADILGCLPGGRFLSVEVKRGKNRPTTLQLEWARVVRQAGGLALVVWSSQELEEALRQEGYLL